MTNINWEKFERLVAAINATKMKGADVKWNDKINGRQFDVVIRFNLGDYKYLTVVECKDYKTKIPVEKVEAFVTKSRGVKANKAVIFSASGFQSGCKKVAKHYNVDLVTLKQTIDAPKEFLESLITPAINIYKIHLKQFGSKRGVLFDEGPKLPYLVNNTTVKVSKGKAISLNSILLHWGNANLSLLSDIESEYSIEIQRGTIVKVPDMESIYNIKSIVFTAKIIDAKIADSPALDPYLMLRKSRKVILLDALTGSKSELMFSDIEHGFDTTLKAKTFYYSPNTGFNYYCKKIEDELVHWLLLESYQHGKKFDVDYTQTIENSIGYVEITKKQELDKLKKYLKKFYRNKRRNKK